MVLRQGTTSVVPICRFLLSFIADFSPRGICFSASPPWRQRHALSADDCSRIMNEQALRNSSSRQLLNPCPCLGEYWWAEIQVMRVGGDDMDSLLLQQLLGGLLRLRPPESGERVGRHLRQAAHLDELRDGIQVLHQVCVALGMSDD